MLFSSVVALTVALFCALPQATVSNVLPKDFARCRPTDEPCLVKRVNDIVQHHSDGVPELKLDRFDPFAMGSIKLKGNPASPVNFDLEMNDLKMYGVSNTTHTKFGGFAKDPKDTKFRAEFSTPRSVIKGKYKISGKLLLLPIVGEGDIEMIIKDLRARVTAGSQVDVRDGKTYTKVTNYKLKLKVNDVEVKMTNLFNGDKVLSENMINIINDNWRLLWDEMEQQFIENISKTDVEIIDKIMNNIPYDELFIID